MGQHTDFYVVARWHATGGHYRFVKYTMGGDHQLFVHDLAALFGTRMDDYRLSKERAAEAVWELSRLGYDAQIITRPPDSEDVHIDLDHLVLQAELRRKKFEDVQRKTIGF